MHFEIAIYRVLHEKKTRKIFTALLMNNDKSKLKITTVMRLYTLKLLYKCNCNIQSRSSHSEVLVKLGVPER